MVREVSSCGTGEPKGDGLGLPAIAKALHVNVSVPGTVGLELQLAQIASSLDELQTSFYVYQTGSEFFLL